MSGLHRLGIALLAAIFGIGPVSRVAAEEAPDFSLPSATGIPHIDFYADHFDNAQSSEVVHLKGHVLLRDATWLMRSDEVWLDTEERHARATGFVQMEDESNSLLGDYGEYYFAASTGSLVNASAGFPPWRIRGRKARVDARRDLRLRHAWFTSCNTDPVSHYHFRSSFMHVRPQKWLYATNVVLFVDRVPIFYTPFMWKSLRKKHILRTRVSPGYDHRIKGLFFKGTTLYDINDRLRGQFFTDEYGRRGLGLGNELEYRAPEGAAGLYSYHIQERHTGLKRWIMQGDAFRSLIPGYSFQMRLQAQSDNRFNNDYIRSHSMPVSPELLNSAALVRSTQLTTTRLSYSRYDVFTSSVYVKQQESIPRIDFNTTALRFGLPWLNNFSAFASNDYFKGLSYIQKTAGAGWQAATQSLRLARGVSFSPSVGYYETYTMRQDQTVGSSVHSDRNLFTGRYNMRGNLRFPTFLGDWDLVQTYVRRLRLNSFAPDLEASDRGVETNLLSLSNYFRPTRLVMVRLTTAYDWRTYTDHMVGFRDRVQPFSADLSLFLWKNFNITAHDEYQLNQGNRSFVMQADVGDRSDRFFGLGVGHSMGSVQHYFVGEDFAWRPSSGTWKVGGAVRQDIYSTGGLRLSRTYFFEKELWITKDWHDFHTRLQFRMRPVDVTEVQIRIELRFDKERRIGPREEAPWRLWKGDEDGLR